MSEKSKGQKLQEKLAYKKKNYYEVASKEEKKEIFAFAEDYKKFLDEAKTEREACAVSAEAAKKAGFTEYRFGDKLKAGDKKYFVNRNKSKIGRASCRERVFILV